MGRKERCSAILDHFGAGHDKPGHPECASRLALACSGIPGDVPRYDAKAASLEDIHRIHEPGYAAWIREQCERVHRIVQIDADTYITPFSYEIALNAAGAAILAAERSLEGEHSFALIRPPGHHAEHNRAMGFCLFNNIAVAAAHLLSEVSRVAIVDWDVHHGNGTQHAFYGTDRVLFCSVHQEHHFPYTGSCGETGTGAGKGFTINVPLPAGSSIAGYNAVFREIFLPALERFHPEVLLVSAGQDILSDDPLGGMEIRPGDLGILTTILKSAGDCPLALVLEGGYGPSHGTAISEIFAALKSDKKPAAVPAPSVQVSDYINRLKALHRIR
jgi:acetoin utilization deacetylase AcuC-like enzyme